MGYYINEASVMAVGILFPVLGIIAVGLRFTVRSKSSTHTFGWDDWLCIPALLLDIAMGILFIDGAARHLIGGPTPPQYETTSQVALQTEYPELTDLEKLEVIFWILSVPAIGFIKLSILLFYRRIFRGKAFGIVYYVMLAIISLWTVAFFLNECFACGTHISYAWSSVQSLSTKCEDTYAANAAVGITDFLVDFALLIIPMPWVWKLKMSVAQKLVVTLIFFIGSFAIGASFYRMIIFVKTLTYPLGSGGDLFGVSGNDVFAVVSTLMFWTYMEIGVGLVACCLPSLRALSQYAPISRAWQVLSSNSSAQHVLSYFRSGSRSTQSPDESYTSDVEEKHHFAERANSQADTEKQANHDSNFIAVRTNIETLEVPASVAKPNPAPDFDLLYNTCSVRASASS